MLLWPPRIQTSPTRMFSSVSVLDFPFTVRFCGVLLASIGSRVTCQERSAPAVALASCPAQETVTVSPASAQPQILRGLSRCSTMFVWKALLTQSPSPMAGNSTTSCLGILSAASARPPASSANRTQGRIVRLIVARTPLAEINRVFFIGLCNCELRVELSRWPGNMRMRK